MFCFVVPLPAVVVVVVVPLGVVVVIVAVFQCKHLTMPNTLAWVRVLSSMRPQRAVRSCD